MAVSLGCFCRRSQAHTGGRPADSAKEGAARGAMHSFPWKWAESSGETHLDARSRRFGVTRAPHLAGRVFAGPESVMTFFRMALKNILHRRLRTSLTLCGVALGIGAFVSLVGFSFSFEQQWLKVYVNSGIDLAVVRGTFFNTTIDEGVGEKLRALPEVADAVPVILNFIDLNPEMNAVFYGWQEDSFEFDPLEIIDGRKFRGDQPEIMLGEILAETLGKRVGDDLVIQGSPFKVVAVFRGGAAFQVGGGLMSLRQLQRLADMGTKVTSFHVRLRPPGNGESPRERVLKARTLIESVLPGLKAVPAAEMASGNQAVILARATAFGTSFIALFVSALGIANTVAMSVFERTKEIGVLRALGWKRSRIMRMILMESSILGLVGGILGLGVGWGALWVLASIRTTANVAQAFIPPVQSVEAITIALTIGLVAGFVPAWRAGRLSPVEALRHD
jgi:putative ABC transport system permease protein